MEVNRLLRENKQSNLRDTDVFLPLLRLGRWEGDYPFRSTG